MRRAMTALFCKLWPVCAIVIVGCIPVESHPFPEATVIGDDGDAILYRALPSATGQDPPDGIFRMDLVTGERTLVLPDVVGSPYDTLTDGRYVAMVEDDTIRVTDLNDGTSSEYASPPLAETVYVYGW